LTKGPYSQLLASRTWATGFAAAAFATPAPFEVWAAMLIPVAMLPAIRKYTKNFVVLVNVLSFPEENSESP
jgi:hypothetical protein